MNEKKAIKVLKLLKKNLIRGRHYLGTWELSRKLESIFNILKFAGTCTGVIYFKDFKKLYLLDGQNDYVQTPKDIYGMWLA